MNHFFLVAAGGAIGASMRHLVGLWSLRWAGPGFPWGTLTVNILGSFLMGLMIELVARRFGASQEMRLFLSTGVLGGFTTFSAFSLDAINLYTRAGAGISTLYVLASLIGAFGALLAGLAIARIFA